MHRIHSGSRCAIKCELRYTLEGKLSDFSTADLKHGFSVGQTYASNVKKIIYGLPIPEHKISVCVAFPVEPSSVVERGMLCNAAEQF